jgi:hypothetical protein
MTAAGAFQSHNRFEVSVEYFCKQATLSVENYYGMGVASMFVIMTAKQLSYVIKGRQTTTSTEPSIPITNIPSSRRTAKTIMAKLGKTRTCV